jgi:uncharacterized small protein (DUF1192 family)
MVISTYAMEWDMLSVMAIESILALLDAEIERLKQVRNLLSATGKVEAKITAAKGRPGRKPGPKPANSSAKKKTVKRVLSPEARKAIADAQRKRWAAQRAKSKS